MQDFVGNELAEGDKVVHVLGKHMRKSVIEKFIFNGPGLLTTEGYSIGKVKMVGIKTEIYSNRIVKTNW